MKPIAVIAATLVVFSSPLAVAETERQLGPHEHGHGTLNLAVEGQSLQMELEVPGADIVGFEHEAKTAADQAKIEAAKKTLAQPLALFALPDAAGCKVTSATIAVAAESDHDEHGHEHEHDADSDDHEAEHSEFRAEYVLSCANVAAITTIAFPYFETFSNSEELAVTLITEKSQKVFEVNRGHTIIDLRGMM